MSSPLQEGPVDYGGPESWGFHTGTNPFAYREFIFSRAVTYGCQPPDRGPRSLTAPISVAPTSIAPELIGHGSESLAPEPPSYDTAVSEHLPSYTQ